MSFRREFDDPFWWFERVVEFSKKEDRPFTFTEKGRYIGLLYRWEKLNLVRVVISRGSPAAVVLPLAQTIEGRVLAKLIPADTIL